MDPEAAEIVREAFRLCVKGYGVSQIASEFMARKLLNPTAYAKSQGRNVLFTKIITGQAVPGLICLQDRSI